MFKLKKKIAVVKVKFGHLENSLVEEIILPKMIKPGLLYLGL